MGDASAVRYSWIPRIHAETHFSRGLVAGEHWLLLFWTRFFVTFRNILLLQIVFIFIFKSILLPPKISPKTTKFQLGLSQVHMLNKQDTT